MNHSNALFAHPLCVQVPQRVYILASARMHVLPLVHANRIRGPLILVTLPLHAISPVSRLATVTETGVIRHVGATASPLLPVSFWGLRPPSPAFLVIAITTSRGITV